MLPSASVERLALELSDRGPDDPVTVELVAWLDASPRFRAFATTYRGKIHKKLRNATDPDTVRDVRAELQAARLLLADRRFEVAFEAYGSGKVGPDLTVTFRKTRTFDVEVTRLRRVPDVAGTGAALAGDQDATVAEIQAFLTGVRPAREPRRVLATVLFTDIVDSTRTAAGMGDARWQALLADHFRDVRRQLDRAGGREIKTVGDGILATFDGPARAIRCAAAIRDDGRALGIELRAGLHTGEIELEPTDIAGLAVHIGARIAALAQGGEILTSSTVRDLVAGSGIDFDDRGSHELKGVPGEWHVYAARL